MRFDILNTVDTDTLLAGGLASLIKGKYRVLDAHELFTEVPELSGRGFSKYVWRQIEKFFYPKYHACYTVSQGVADELKSVYGIEFKVIRNVPLKLNSQQDVQKEDRFILYQGALNEGRGLEELIAVAHLVDAPIKLAGEGDLSDHLRSLVSSDKVAFLGYLSPAELQKISRKAYIGVNLLKNYSLNYYHSLANKFFDYVHAGIPSVNMKFPEYERLNSEFEVSILIDSLEPSVLAESLNNLLKDRDLYVNMQRNCQKAAEAWNWQKEEKLLFKIYDELGG